MGHYSFILLREVQDWEVDELVKFTEGLYAMQDIGTGRFFEVESCVIVGGGGEVIFGECLQFA